MVQTHHAYLFRDGVQEVIGPLIKQTLSRFLNCSSMKLLSNVKRLCPIIFIKMTSSKETDKNGPFNSESNFLSVSI